MRRIALTAAAAAALAASSPAAAAITVVDYTASGPGSGTFTLEYDSSTDAFTLTAMNFTLGSTTFTTSTAAIGPGASPPHPFVPTLVGGDPSSIETVSKFAGVDDFSFLFDPTMLASQTVFLSYYIAGDNGLSDGKETITGEVIRGPGFVPEPASWAMMLLGFGAIGVAVRRRRNNIAFA